MGKGWGENPKYIVEALLEEKHNLDIVWLVNDKKTLMPHQIRKVKYNTPQAIKEYLTARVWIDNVKNSVKPNKRKNQFYLQTWHAGLGLKASERQIENTLSSNYIKDAKRDADMTNLMLSDSVWTTEIYKNWFWYEGPIVKTGFPRNDILINPSHNINEKVYKYFNLAKDTKILLYAPTFRDKDNDLKVYKFDFFKILSVLRKKFDSNYVVLVKLHPNLSNQTIQEKIYKFNSRIINATMYPDMQELIVSSDILITDYSSCMFDAMLAGKKVFLLAKDFQKFREKDRDLLFNIKEDLPFSFANNEAEIIENIENFNINQYQKDVVNFSKKMGLYEDGKSSKRVAKIILDHLKLKEKTNEN